VRDVSREYSHENSHRHPLFICIFPLPSSIRTFYPSSLLPVFSSILLFILYFPLYITPFILYLPLSSSSRIFSHHSSCIFPLSSSSPVFILYFPSIHSSMHVFSLYPILYSACFCSIHLHPPLDEVPNRRHFPTTGRDALHLLLCEDVFKAVGDGLLTAEQAMTLGASPRHSFSFHYAIRALRAGVDPVQPVFALFILYSSPSTGPSCSFR
jgi:hypothetical protein